MNPSKFLASCAFDDELGLETNADRLEGRLKAILRHRSEDWLRGLPQMFSPDWKEAVSALGKELKRTTTVGEAFAFLWDIKQRKKPDQMSYPEIIRTAELVGVRLHTATVRKLEPTGLGLSGHSETGHWLGVKTAMSAPSQRDRRGTSNIPEVSFR